MFHAHHHDLLRAVGARRGRGSWGGDATGMARRAGGDNVNPVERADDAHGFGRGDAGTLEALETRVLMSAMTFADLADRFNLPGNLHDIQNPGAEYESFGHAATALGDIDGDGFGDFAISAPGSVFGAETPVAGAVFLYSGQNGTIIRTLADGTAGFGFSLANVGDVNGDGVNDLLIGSPQHDANADAVIDQFGRAWIYSGADGAEVRFHDGAGASDEFGFALALLGDVNGDSVNDYAIGAPGAGGAAEGQVMVFSGGDGAVIFTFSGEAAGHRFGAALFGADIGLAGSDAGDGVADILIGAPGREAAPEFAGRVYVYDGATGTLRWSADGENAGDRFGTAVAFIDGAESVIYVGTPGYDVSDLHDAGRVYRYHQDGTLRTDNPTLDGLFAGGAYGQAIVVLGDIDGDGAGDLAFTAPGNDANFRVTLHQGGSAEGVNIAIPDAARQWFGDALFSLGDVDNDGFADIGSAFHAEGRFAAVSSLAAVPPTAIGLASDNLAYFFSAGAGGRAFAVVNGEIMALERVPGLIRTDTVLGLNNAGDIVVRSDVSGEEGIFIIRGGVRTRLQDLLEGIPTDPAPIYSAFQFAAIGNNGDVLFQDVDSSTDEGAVTRSWILRGTALSFLWRGEVRDVNDSGEVLGVRHTTDGPVIVLRAADGASEETIDLADAFRVNNHGLVVGISDAGNLATWSDGTVTEIGVIEEAPGEGETRTWIVNGVNDDGRVLATLSVESNDPEVDTRLTSYLFVPDEGLTRVSDITFDVDAGEDIHAQLVTLGSDGTIVSRNGFFSIVADDAPWVGLGGAPIWAAASGDSLGFAAVNQYGDVIYMQRTDDGWQGRRLDIEMLSILDSFTVTDLLTFTDSQGATFVFIVSEVASYVAAVGDTASPSPIAARLLTGGQGSTQIVGHATVFESADGRVHLAGTDANGDIIIYYELTPDAGAPFVFDNLTGVHIEGQELEFNAVASNLTALVTPWGASHLFYLDDAGALYSVWIGTDMVYWVYTNISENLNVGSINDNPALALTGTITAYGTAWGGLNVAGSDLDGDPTAIWWVPGFGGTWHRDKLHGFDDQPVVAFNPDSVTSYGSPWESLHVASIQESGEIAVYWWGPGAPRWDAEILNIAERPEGLTFTGEITSATMGDTLNLFARGSDGDLYRLFWNPGDLDVWSIENITESVA